MYATKGQIIEAIRNELNDQTLAVSVGDEENWSALGVEKHNIIYEGRWAVDGEKDGKPSILILVEWPNEAIRTAARILISGAVKSSRALGMPIQEIAEMYTEELDKLL